MLSSLAIAEQGVGYAPLVLALQGFVDVESTTSVGGAGRGVFGTMSGLRSEERANRKLLLREDEVVLAVIATALQMGILDADK